jgi:hypothetical protein
MTFEDLYTITKPAIDAAGKQSFKEYKKSGTPRTFTELFGERQLQESSTLHTILRHINEARDLLDTVLDDKAVQEIDKILYEAADTVSKYL